jgi:UDPglucose 6-dehydrogenase
MMTPYPKIGIVGLGVVGNAVKQSFESCGELVTIDIDKNKGFHTYEDIRDCEAIFVCVPSPMSADGRCDASALESVLHSIGKDYTGVIISKVTATPDIYQKLENDYKNLVYVPEFLTEANANQDYHRSSFFVIGGSINAYKKEAERILSYTHKTSSFYKCSIAEASLIKYIINSFLATKVVFMNEFFSLSQAYNCNWNTVAQGLSLDQRMGNSHTRVPGPDGSFGFGGMCFPKDVSAILKNAEDHQVNLNTLKEANKKNTLLRLTQPK